MERHPSRPLVLAMPIQSAYGGVGEIKDSLEWMGMRDYFAGYVRFPSPSPERTAMSIATTNALGEEGPYPSTDSLGEEGPFPSTDALGEEGPFPTTYRIGEEGGPYPSTDSLGEEGPYPSTDDVGEEDPYSSAASVRVENPFGAF
jgi:hypothetical protein